MESHRQLTPADLGGRVIDALVPARPGAAYQPPTWSQVWADVRTVFGPVRSLAFISTVILLFPFQLLWLGTRRLIAKPVVMALVLTAILGSGALWIWGWRGLFVVCLLVWLFTLFRQNQKF